MMLNQAGGGKEGDVTPVPTTAQTNRIPQQPSFSSTFFMTIFAVGFILVLSFAVDVIITLCYCSLLRFYRGNEIRIPEMTAFGEVKLHKPNNYFFPRRPS